MKHFSRLLSLITFLLILSVAGFSQVQTIDKEAYFSAYRQAEKKKAETTYRKTTISKEIRNDDLAVTSEQVYESDPSGSVRSKTLKYNNKETSTLEYIRIAKDHYCRKDSGEWTHSNRFCGESAGRSIPANAEQKFTLEIKDEGKESVRIYKWYSTYIFGAETPEEHFYESKIVLDSKGNIIREETNVGETRSKKLFFNEVVTYQHSPTNPKIKIEPPIN